MNDGWVDDDDGWVDDQDDLFDKFNKSWINQPLLGTNASQGIQKRNEATYGTLDEPLIDRALFPGMGRVANLGRDYGLSVQHGLAGTAEGFSTPLNLATMAAGVGAAKTAGTMFSRPLTWIERGLSAPVAVSGVDKMTDSSLDPYQRFMGLTEFAGGIAGGKAPFFEAPTARPQGKIHGFDTIPLGKENPSTWEGFGPKPKVDEAGWTDLPLNQEVPVDASGRDLGGYAGPERRQTGERNTVSDAIFQAYRDSFARGEDVRSPQSRELFKKQQDTNQFREDAEQSYTQIEDEIGDIVIDKQGNEHQFMGLDSRGKQIWKLTGRRDEGVTPEQVVDEMPPQRDLFETPSHMSNREVPPDRFTIDPDTFGIEERPDIFQNNASGESSASIEGMNTIASMKKNNEVFVVYDRAGNRRSLEAMGVDGKDYNPVNGETFGIERNGIFTPLTHRGGVVPQTSFKKQLTELKKTISNFAKDDEGSINFGPAKRSIRDILGLSDKMDRREFLRRATRSPEKSRHDLAKMFGPKFHNQIEKILQEGGWKDGTHLDNMDAYVDAVERAWETVASRSPEMRAMKDIIDRGYTNAWTGNLMKYNDIPDMPTGIIGNIAEELKQRFIKESEPEFPSRMAEGKNPDLIGMELAQEDPTDIMRAYLNTYSEAGGRVATKELLQNAIDAAQDTGGEVSVTIDHKDQTVTVTDTGNGLTREMIGKEFTNLTASGKRGGPTKKIGEMGVGKTTYLLGAKRSRVETVALEPNGQMMKYEFEGTPEDYYTQTVRVISTPVDKNTPTGTKVTIWNEDAKQTGASHDFLKQFKKFSNSPVKVKLNSLEYPSFVDSTTGKPKPGYESHHESSNILEDVIPRTFGGGREIASGTAVGGNYRLSIPPQMEWGERNQIALILMNRGMFQGVDSIWVTKGELPEAVMVEIDPTVDGLNKEYPLTAPTRERLKDSFKNPIKNIINIELVEKAEAARKARLQISYDSLVPAKGRNFVTLDSGGRYTPQELSQFNNHPVIRETAYQMQLLLNKLDSLFPVGTPGGQLGRTSKFGFILGDENSGGINIPNPSAPYSAREYAILINPFASFAQGTPAQAARHIVHTIKHEFNHNRARNEGADFTWKLSQVDSKLPIEVESYVIGEILKLISKKPGQYAPELQGLLQQHTAARRRPDTIPDLLSKERTSEFIKGPKQGGISGGTGPNGAGVQASNIKPTGGRTTPPITPQQNQAALAQLYQMQQVHKMVPPGPVKQSLYGKIRDFNKTLLTSMDISAAGRQGLPLIAEPEYWSSMEAMFNSLGSQAYFDNLKDMVAKSPLAQPRYVPVINKRGQKVISPITQSVKLKELPSFYDEWGLDLAHREETQGSALAEMIPGVKQSNRAFSGFLTKLRFDTFNRMAQDLMNQGIDIQKDITVGKHLAEFVNNSTGRGDLGKLKKFAPVLNEVFFAPRLMAAKVRRFSQVFDPRTYTQMNPMIRKAAWKSLISTAAFGLAFGQLARVFGAQVNPDPTNSDFGKIRIGDTRIDPFGGDQQYIVAAARMLSGKYTSPNNPNRGQQADTVQEYFKNMGTVGGRFTRNKFSPFLGFATTMFTGTDSVGRKFDPMTHSMEAIIPLVIQDISDLVQEDPNLFPLGVLPVLGIGTQSFSKPNRRP